MQTGISLTDLARRIEANKELKQDYLVDTRAVSYRVAEDRVVSLRTEAGDFPLLPLAHNQIGAHLGIPARYYDRMLREAPGLLADSVDTWLTRQPPARRMVRTLGGDVRAFLSDRYQRIEHEEIAEVVLPVLAAIPDVQIVSAQITERRLYIQAVSPRTAGEVKRGDVVQAGVVISNSEVGCGAVTVSPMVWRLACLNGMILPDARLRAYHVGRQIADNAELWRADTVRADDRAVLLKVRDVVAAAVDQVGFASRIDRMRELASGVAQITGDVPRAIEVLARKVGLGDDERSGVMRSLIEGGDLTAWGLLNAVTHQAHTVQSYDRAVELEAVGGQMLGMPAREWSEVLAAA